MSTVRRFLLSRSPLRIARARLAGLLAAAALVWVLAPAEARAQDNMLRGPHPFLKDNEIEGYVLLATGLSSSPSGTKLAFDYDYKLVLPTWLVLQLNLQLSSCHTTPGVMLCGPDTGKAFETLAGAGWKWATPIPLVPFAKATAGPVFVFPNGANAAAGFTGRLAGGVTYFFFDWLGIGAELAFSLGHVGYDATFPNSNHTYAIFDFGGGIQFQF